jgi:hypothetical protein
MTSSFVRSMINYPSMNENIASRDSALALRVLYLPNNVPLNLTIPANAASSLQGLYWTFPSPQRAVLRFMPHDPEPQSASRSVAGGSDGQKAGHQSEHFNSVCQVNFAIVTDLYCSFKELGCCLCCGDAPELRPIDLLCYSCSVFLSSESLFRCSERMHVLLTPS